MRLDLGFVLDIIQGGDWPGGNTVQDARSSFRSVATAPGPGTADVQTLTINGSPDGGTFQLMYEGVRIAPQAFNVALADLQTALNGLVGIGTGGVVVTGTPGSSYVVTWQVPGVRPLLVVPADAMKLTKSGSPVATPTVVNTTPGVDPDGKGTPALGCVKALDTGHVWRNDGTQAAPSWTDIGVLL